ncbi:MFS transporter [Cysteiniphilum litorale]|uniref:MFS transporter n=1 Tax=Cysteiniphilum litorale TaxID=2056700 RepID=UPI003F8821D5
MYIPITNHFTEFLGCSYFMASDMYVPSLPSMSHALSASSSMARLTIGAFLVALAFSQLFYDPASDKMGRKKIIYIGAIIYLVGSIFCMFAWSIDTLIVGRIIQGVGTGALLPLSRVIVQDSVAARHGERNARSSRQGRRGFIPSARRAVGARASLCLKLYF